MWAISPWKTRTSFFSTSNTKDQAALDAHRNAPYFKQYVTGGLDAIMEQRTRELYSAVD